MNADRNCGFLSTITHALGEMHTSQSVKAYNASIVISGEIPGASSIMISTSAAVLSVTFFILIFPWSFAFTMTVHQLRSGNTIRNISNNQCFFIQLFNCGTYPYLSPAFSFIIIGNIHHSASLKIGK